VDEVLKPKANLNDIEYQVYFTSTQSFQAWNDVLVHTNYRRGDPRGHP